MPYMQNIQPANYLVGQVADSNPYASLSAVNAETSLAIPFGVAVKLDGATGGFKLPAAIGDVSNRMAVAMIGTRARSFGYVSGNWVANDTNQVNAGQSLSAMTEGTIAVTVEQAVTFGSPVFIRFAAGAGGTQLGAFRGDLDTDKAAQHPYWFYESSASAGGIAVVRVS